MSQLSLFEGDEFEGDESKKPEKSENVNNGEDLNLINPKKREKNPNQLELFPKSTQGQEKKEEENKPPEAETCCLFPWLSDSNPSSSGKA